MPVHTNCASILNHSWVQSQRPENFSKVHRLLLLFECLILIAQWWALSQSVKGSSKINDTVNNQRILNPNNRNVKILDESLLTATFVVEELTLYWTEESFQTFHGEWSLGKGKNKYDTSLSLKLEYICPLSRLQWRSERGVQTRV